MNKIHNEELHNFFSPNTRLNETNVSELNGRGM
jgi:hypothetical protein